MRSRPQDGVGVCVSEILTSPSCSTRATDGSAARRLAWVSDIWAEKPRRADLYVCVTFALYLALRFSTLLVLKSFSTTM